MIIFHKNFCETMDKSKIRVIFEYEFHCGTNAVQTAYTHRELFSHIVNNPYIVGIGSVAQEVRYSRPVLNDCNMVETNLYIT